MDEVYKNLSILPLEEPLTRVPQVPNLTPTYRDLPYMLLAASLLVTQAISLMLLVTHTHLQLLVNKELDVSKPAVMQATSMQLISQAQHVCLQGTSCPAAES